MAYEQIRMARQKVLYDNTNAATPLTAQLVLAGAKVTPASATITIYRKGVSTALVSAASMTVSGTLMTYSVDTTTEASWPIETGYRAVLAVTVGSGESAVVHQMHLIFDIVRYMVRCRVTWDRLVAIDDSIVGSLHNGDEDLSPLIEAVRDMAQAALEAKIVNGKKMVENYILDTSATDTAVAFGVLAQHMLNKGMMEKYKIYRDYFERTLNDVLATLRFDTGQSGEESATPGGIHEVTFVT
jgi:hypothetical protein